MVGVSVGSGVSVGKGVSVGRGVSVIVKGVGVLIEVIVFVGIPVCMVESVDWQAAQVPVMRIRMKRNFFIMLFFKA
jgi:hypothetical protein